MRQQEIEHAARPTQTHEYEQCESCGAPVDRTQRYCVECGTRRRHVRDPAARYLSSATRRSRTPAAGPQPRRSARSPGIGLALALAMIPVSVGLGVLVGRSSTGGDDKLIAALRVQKPEVITAAGSGAASSAADSAATPAATSRSVSTLTSNFPLQTGYTVELETLPANSTAADVTKAEHADAVKAGGHAGLILQRDYRLTPLPPAGSYVIFAGAYKTKAAAANALAKLHTSFASATVVQVQAAGTTAAPSGKVLAKTQYGLAHQVAGFKPSQAQLSAGAQAVSKVQSQAGKSYVNSQRGLPDQISVP